MCKRQSHWPAITYYRPFFDFSNSIRANADYVINIHEPRSSIILRAFYIVISVYICMCVCVYIYIYIYIYI